MSLLDTVESLKNEIRQLKEAKEAGDESVRSESPTTQTPAPEEEPHPAPGSRGREYVGMGNGHWKRTLRKRGFKEGKRKGDKFQQQPCSIDQTKTQNFRANPTQSEMAKCEVLDNCPATRPRPVQLCSAKSGIG